MCVDKGQAWLDFGRGHWTKAAPTRPGRYPIADPRGTVVDATLHVSVHHDELHYMLFGAWSHTMPDIWDGWVWSHPRPELPRPKVQKEASDAA